LHALHSWGTFVIMSGSKSNKCNCIVLNIKEAIIKRFDVGCLFVHRYLLPSLVFQTVRLHFPGDTNNVLEPMSQEP